MCSLRAGDRHLCDLLQKCLLSGLFSKLSRHVMQQLWQSVMQSAHLPFFERE